MKQFLMVATLAAASGGSAPPRYPLKRTIAFASWLVVLLTAAASRAQEAYPPPGFEILKSEESPRGGFKLVHYKKDLEDFSSESQIWMEPLKPEFQRQKLFKHNNRSFWLMDTAESHIAIAHHEFSSDNLLWVFVRQPDGQFRRVEDELRDAGLKEFCAKTHVQKSRDDFDHFDCYPEVWLRGGLLVAYIRGDSHTQRFYLKPWYFIYDADEQKIVWDDFDSNNEALVIETSLGRK
jgi:hypothetical protein